MAAPLNLVTFYYVDHSGNYGSKSFEPSFRNEIVTIDISIPVNTYVFAIAFNGMKCTLKIAYNIFGQFFTDYELLDISSKTPVIPKEEFSGIQRDFTVDFTLENIHYI